jgi:GH18 family chitinase
MMTPRSSIVTLGLLRMNSITRQHEFARRSVALMGLILAVTGSLYGAEPEKDFRVVGYLPDYRLSAFDPAAGRFVTDLVCFSITPEPGKPLDYPPLAEPAVTRILDELRTTHRVRLTCTLGGWNRSAGFAALTATPAARRDFIREIVRFCERHDFAGVDLDWEHPETPEQSTAYAALMIELKPALGPHRTLTAAVAGWQRIPREGYAALDAVHLMAYDHPGRHSTLEQAQADVGRLIEQGVAPRKIRLGIPFYGRDTANPERVRTYREIIEQYAPPAERDEVDGLFYNGPDLVRAKLKYSRAAGLGGVMLWELGQDATGEQSLLGVIHQTVGAR